MAHVHLSEFSLFLEVQDQYPEKRNFASINESVDLLQEENPDWFDDEEEAQVFWVSLAKAQIRRRELTSAVAEKAKPALEALSNQYNLYPREVQSLSTCMSDQKYYASEVKLRAKGSTRKRKYYQCPWKIGDVYAFELKGQEAQDLGIKGDLCLLRKIDERANYPRKNQNTVPILYMTICKKNALPKNEHELEEAGFLTSNVRQRYPYTHIEYRILFIIDSPKELEPLGLVYLGNYANARIPVDEVSFEKSELMPLQSPRWFEKWICAYYKHGGILHPNLQPSNSEILKM